MSPTDESREEPVKEHHLPTARDEVLVDPELSVRGHGELQEVGMVAALAQHHPHTGQLYVGH